MKTSRVFLLGVAGLVVLLIITLTIVMRVTLERNTGNPEDPVTIGEFDSFGATTYDFDGFRVVDTTGSWSVTISDTAESLEVEIPEKLLPHVTVRQNGDRLVLYLEPNTKIDDQDGLRAKIPSGIIDEVVSAGALNLRLEWITAGRFTIKTVGGSNVVSVGGSIESVFLDASGAVNFDLSDTPVVDARIDAVGAGNINLQMNGGNLTGSVSGAALLSYRGNARHVEVSTAGLAKVRHVVR